MTRRAEPPSNLSARRVTRRTEASSAFGEVIRMLGNIALVTRRAPSEELTSGAQRVIRQQLPTS